MADMARPGRGRGDAAFRRLGGPRLRRRTGRSQHRGEVDRFLGDSTHNDCMKLVAVRVDAAVIDELLRDIAQRPVDVSDPNWMAKLRQAPPPVEEAGVAAEAA